MQLHQSGQLPGAEALYRQILARHPEHADALHMLGLLAFQRGRPPVALRLMAQALRVNAGAAPCLANLGIVFTAVGRLESAIAVNRRALRVQPRYPEALNNLGNLLLVSGLSDEAIASFNEAIRQRPEYSQAQANLSRAQQNISPPPLPPPPKDPILLDAIADAERSIGLLLDTAQAHFNLGNALLAIDDPDAAIAVYQKALQMQPNYSDAHNNLGNALKDSGRLTDALEHFQIAARQAIPPQTSTAGDSNFVYSILFHPDYSQQAIRDALGRWNGRHAAAITAAALPHPRPVGTAKRKLRIGYVSPDLRDHVVGRNVLPIFERHDHSEFEVFYYSAVEAPDEITARFVANADRWHDITGMPDADAAKQIRADGIDVLVDLSLHLAHHRLLIFAGKPAPVQITWAGYPGSTGLTAMDWRISDPHLDPPGLNDDYYSEKTEYLPHSFWCYDPLGIDLQPNDLPAQRNGFTTFGCLNNICKINAEVLNLWASVMAGDPDSHLVLMARSHSARQWVRQSMAREGIPADRIDFVEPGPRVEYLRHYHGIDIGLDSYPYNGHSTSLDSFWMGVPVVSLMGDKAISRAGYSQLMNLDLPQLAVRTQGDFRAAALGLAQNPEGLADLRATLRQRMQGSPLMDAGRFAGDLETLYRRCWQHFANP